MHFSTHVKAVRKRDARWSCGRRSTSIRSARPPQARHTTRARAQGTHTHIQRAPAATRASAARAARCARLGHAPAARLRPSAAPSATHARRCGVPLSAPARRHARHRRPRDEAAAAARLLVAPPPVAPSAAADLEEVAPVRPGSLAIRGGHANNPPRQPTISRPPREGLRADLARAARDVAGKLGWRRARLRRGARGRARLSSQRERRQKPRWPAWVETSTAIQKFLQAAHARQARGAGSVAEARRAHSSAEGVSAGRRPPSASVCFAMKD